MSRLLWRWMPARARMAPVTSLLVLADDLTGAADTGVAFAEAGLDSVLHLGGADAGPFRVPQPQVVCVDTDTRGRDGGTAAAAVRRAVHDSGPPRWTYKKVDSTLRGNVAVETAAALDETGSDVALLAPAFPATGRTTVAGRQYVHGEPLARAGVWRRAVAPAPDRVADLFAGMGLATAGIGIRDIRAGRDRVAAELRSVAAGGARIVVCDAETEADLAAVAEGGAGCSELRVLWSGSGGLASRLAAPLGLPATATEGDCLPSPSRVGQGPLLAVVGSAAKQSRAQAAALLRAGFEEVPLPAATLLEGTEAQRLGLSAEVARALRDGDTVVTVAEGRGLGERVTASGVAGALGRTVAGEVPDAVGLLLTGGETARAVLGGAGVRTLRLLGEVEPGVVVSRTDPAGGLPVVTKAGAFGDDLAFVRAARALVSHRRGPTEQRGAR